MEEERLTAEEAKRIADSSCNVLKDRVYDAIRNAALEGDIKLDYTFENPNAQLIISLQEDLESHGYVVTTESEAESTVVIMHINWNISDDE